MKKEKINLNESVRKTSLTDSQIKSKKLELSKLWGSDFWQGDLDEMRTCEL